MRILQVSHCVARIGLPPAGARAFRRFSKTSIEVLRLYPGKTGKVSTTDQDTAQKYTLDGVEQNDRQCLWPRRQVDLKTELPGKCLNICIRQNEGLIKAPGPVQKDCMAPPVKDDVITSGRNPDLTIKQGDADTLTNLCNEIGASYGQFCIGKEKGALILFENFASGDIVNCTFQHPRLKCARCLIQHKFINDEV